MNGEGVPLRGDFSELGLPEILDFLKTTARTGVLLLRNGATTKTVHFKRGVVIFATSNIPDERFGEMLLSSGKISKEQFDEASKFVSRGKRLGKVLVEMQALSPKDLWNEVRRQVQEIAYSVLAWESGSFQFIEGSEKTGENITTSLTVPELLLNGLRKIKTRGVFSRKIPSRDVIFERVLPVNRPHGLQFEEYEKHVFKLVDGNRSVQEVCDLSEIGDFETLKTLYIFFCIGYLHVKGKRHGFEEERKEIQELMQLVKDYNSLFSFLYHYLLREVGPITENILEKYLGRLKVSQPEVFGRVTIRSRGSLSEERIIENIKAIGSDRRAILVNALNEYLYSAILAIRRTLGPEHEKKVIETLKSTRKDLFRETG